MEARTKDGLRIITEEEIARDYMTLEEFRDNLLNATQLYFANRK